MQILLARNMLMKNERNIEMKRFITLLSFSVAFFCASAAPFSYDEAASNVQEFVVIGITNSIRSASIALMHDPRNDLDDYYRPPMLYHIQAELGLEELYCVETLKGVVSTGGYCKCYYYDTPRRAYELPPLGVVDMADEEDDELDGLWCFDGKKVIRLVGKEKWMYYPPYDPYMSRSDDFVKLMLLTPESQLDFRRIKLYDPADGWTNTIADIIGRNYANKTPAEIMRKLNIESVFSNRVFRLNEACSFQVDYPVPDNDAWPRYLYKTKAEYNAWMNRFHASNTSLMHLSPDEVSEITYLAYFADNVNTNGYNAACARCPLILRPVIEFKTTIGKRLRQAMSEGGMITTNNLPNVAAAP